MSLLSKSVRLVLRHNVPSLANATRYELAPEQRIGRGSKRDCYLHPNDARLCIKVARRPHRPGAQQASIVEWYCARSLDQRHVAFTHRARCLGWVATNHGPGLVVERIYNDDGTPAPTLYEAVHADGVERARIGPMFSELKGWVLANGVPVTDLNTGNLLVRQTNDTTSLVLVDGIGGQKVKIKFVLYRRFGWFARLMSRRRWARLENQAHRELHADDVSHPVSVSTPTPPRLH